MKKMNSSECYCLPKVWIITYIIVACSIAWNAFDTNICFVLECLPNMSLSGLTRVPLKIIASTHRHNFR